MKQRCLSLFLVLCLIFGMAPAITIPAAAAEPGGALELPKGAGSGKGFIYYNFVETTTFTPGTTYAFLDAAYGQEDAVAQLGSGAVLEATDKENKCHQYMLMYYYLQGVSPEEISVTAYVNVVKPGKGFDHCPAGGLYRIPNTSNPTEYRYFCRAGGAQNCGPLYAYTYDTAEVTWENVTVYLNDPGNTSSNNSADYTVKLTYGQGQTVTLDPRSYTVSCSGKTATVTITDNDGNTIRGTVTLPCGVVYQPGGLNVTGMPANQGILPGGTVTAAQGPTRSGYVFQHWTDSQQIFAVGDSIPYQAEGNYTLTAVWKDVQAPEFTCGAVEVMTGTSGEMVQNSIKAALKITDNEPVTECTVTVDADDTTAKTRGDTQVSVTVRDAAGNETTKNVTLTVLPGPLAFSEPVYESGTLSSTLLEPGPDDITETGIVWSVMSNPTTTVNNGVYVTPSPVTTPDTSISTPVELAQGVPYYARAYAVVNGVTYYGPQSTIGDDIPEYGVFTITNSGGNTFTVSRSGGSDGEQTVSYRTVNGSAVGGVHFTHQNSTLTFAAGETSKTITITEQGVNAIYGGNAATGYSNDSRTYSVEIYRVDGGAVIENNRAAAKRTMTGSTTVDPSLYNEKTINGTQTVVQQSHDSWSDNANETVTVTVENKEYCQGTADYLKYWVTFQACEEEDGYQAIQICAGSEIDTGLSHDNDGNIGNVNDAGRTAVYAASFMHGGDGRNTSYAEYTFPTDSAATWNNGSGLKSYSYKAGQSGNFIAFDFDIETITLGFKASGKDQDDWFRQNVVHHFQVSDTQEPQLLAVADMGDSTYRVGDSFTVSLIFDEIVDSTNSTLSGKTITTSWGTATYAGGANTNVLYFTGTVPANATNTLTVTGIDASAVIKDMAGNGGTSSASGSTTASVDTRTPSFDLSAGSISGGVARATISNANGNTTALRYAWSQSADLPATGWIPLTSEELAAARTPGDFQAMTRQDAGSGVWYLHVLGVCDGNGALAYRQTSVDFGTGGSIPGDPDPAPPAPSISVSVDNTNWATSRTITVTYANGTAEYRYGMEAWQPVSGSSVTVTKNGTYAFRCVSSSSGEAATASAAVEKIDTIDPTASIGAMAANTPTQKDGVYHSITLPINYGDTQSGVKTVEYVWSSSATAPNSGWTSVESDTQLTYTATENSETGIYLHLRVTDQVGHAVTVSSPAYQVISEEGAKHYAPTITIGLANKGGEGFTPWDGTSWTNETQTLEWKLVGEHTENCVVTLPDGRTTSDTSGTILVSQNGTYTVSVVDNTYGGSHSSSYTIDKIDTTAPTATHTEAPTGWQSSPVTIDFTFADQGGSGLHTAQYAVVTDNTTPPADLTAFSANTGGSVTVSQDGEWYLYYAVTDGTAGTYGDGTPRSANTTSGFVGPIQVNTGKPTLEISGGETGADSLTLTVISDGSVKVSKDGGTAEPVSGTYTVTEAGTYTFTATSNSGLTTQKEVEVYSITFDSGVSPQLVVSGGTATQPADPQKTGYTFGGWKNGQTAWDFDAPVTADLTLTAQWTLDTPAVTLTASKTEVTYGEEITLTAHAGHSGAENVTLTYTWYKDDSKLTGETNASLTLKDVAHSGSYKVEVTASGDGQTQVSSSNTVEVTIAPRPVVLDWDYAAPIPYDGQTHTVTATITNLVDADVCHLTYQGTRESSSAGSHEVTVTALDNPNYTLDGAVNTTLVWQITSTSGSASVTMGDWTYGDPAKTPVPASDTHGTGSVTYRYTGTTTGGVPYDSDAVPTDAGNYTVTATFAATGHYEAVTATAEFTIAKKAISATWQGLNWVYGQPVQVDALLSDIVKGDQVTVTVTGVGQTVGSHPLTSTLEGADVDNYTLENHTATLTIQPKPVLFAVADNVVQADGGEKGATVTADDKNCAYTVTYRQNGGQVTSPREAGSYEIWVKITDSSYRHTDGSSEMQVGTLTITQAPPVVYTVSFVGGEGTEGSMSPLEAMGGSLLTLPDCGYQKDDYKFTGWLYNGQTYQPGGRFTMPEEDVIFTAQWQETFTISGIITEETDGEDAKVENAVVSLWLGANKMGETSTDKDGKYRFDNLTPGIYNLVVTKDVRTVTSKVELTKNTTCNATLPKGATNSIVNVTPGSPDIVVGELDTVFDHPDDTVYTEADQTTVQAGGKVEITFTAAVKQKTDVATDLEKIQSISGSSSLALTMDYALTKTVTEPDGDKREPQSISQSNVLLEVLLPLPTELQGKASYSVYRVHSGQAQELKEGKANQNALGEYFTVSGNKTGLTLYVRCFSTYAVGYSDTPVTPTPPDNNNGGGSGGGSSTPTYPPNIEQPEHGSVSIEPSKPQKGDEVTITPTPEDGYTVDEVIVTGPGGEAVEVTPNGDGSYTFTQPAGKVTITVTFRQIADAADCPRDESCPMADFSDTDLHAWYHDGIHYCLEHGLMVGTGKHTFEPNTSTSRGMLVTILWRLEGSPVVDASMAYSDVKPEDWYGQAVGWGDQSGVVTGYGNGKFGPNDPITREQMAAMLWRYAGSPAVDGSLSSFVDGGQTSDWARTAMIWAVEQGLITGVGHDRLNPQGQATRAEAATILMRLIENRA